MRTRDIDVEDTESTVGKDCGGPLVVVPVLG